MIKKYFCKLLDNLNNNKLHQEIKKYIEENPCCVFFPNCNHPKIQSGPFLDKKFNLIKKSLDLSLQNYLNTNLENIVYRKTWCYYNSKNSNVEKNWHNHLVIKGLREISALCYLNDTNLGTVFEGDFKIIPEINTWYIWPSYLEHSPEPGYTEEERIVVASAIGIKNSF